MTATIELSNDDPAQSTPEADTAKVPATVSYGWAPRSSLVVAASLTVFLLILNSFVSSESAGSFPEALRAIAVIAGMLLLPGIPIVVLLRIPGRALAASLIFGISTSVNILAAQFTMIDDRWNPVGTQTGLLVVAAVLIIAAWFTVPSRRRTGRLGLSAGSWTIRRGIHLIALAVACGALFLAANGIDIISAGALGVLPELNVAYFVGLLILAAVLVDVLRTRHLDTIVLSVATVVAIAYNCMLVAIATHETTVPNSFVHRGFISVIADISALPADQDARFSWAGFFTAAAHLQIVADLKDTTGLLIWAPLVFGVLTSFGLYAIAIAITGRARLAWISVLLFHCVNWYQQDYFAPQATALLGYVAVIATMLWMLRAAPLPRVTGTLWQRIFGATRRTIGRPTGYGPIRTLALGGVLLAVITANVVSHQMTPILLVLALFAFTITGTARYRTLWLAAGLVFAAWFSYGATDYWLGHLQSLFAELGQVSNSVDQGVSQRLSGDPLYQRMQYLRMAASGGFVVLGMIGWLMWRPAKKRALWVGALLCAAPGGLIALQSYGGEMIIRAFLLSAPVIAPFAAMGCAAIWYRASHSLTADALPRTLLSAHRAPFGKRYRVLPRSLARLVLRLPHLTGRSARVLAVGVLIVVVFAAGLLETTNRGLNTAFEGSTRGEVTITDDFIRLLPPNTAVMTFSHAPHTIGIRRLVDPTGPRFGYIDSYPCLDDVADCALDRVPDYIYITNQGIKMIDLQYGRSEELLRSDIRRILESGQYVINTDTDSVLILRRKTAEALYLPAAAGEPHGRSMA